MIAAIMQPTYLPWAGYFNLINQVDIFFFLDDAQFTKQSWHNRNRILRNNKEVLITIPLKKKKNETTINNCLVFDLKDWKKKHANIIYNCYFKHPFFSCIKEILDSYDKILFNNLSEINIFFIKFICEKLLIKSNFVKTSETGILGKRTERTIKILEKFNVKKYISPEGSKEYLTKDKFIERTNIILIFNNFISMKYNQLNNDNFIENLSILDVIANLGWKDSKIYINNGFNEK
jgi:hypothetical protein